MAEIMAIREMVVVVNHTNVTSEKEELEEDDEDLRAQTRLLYFIGYGVIMLIMCILGVVGNILNLVVFGQRRYRAVTYVIFRYLAVADLGAVLFWLPEVARLGWYIGVDGMPRVSTAFYYAHFSFPLINFAIISGSLLVLAVSVERYVAVCHPLEVQRYGLSKAGRLPLVVILAFSVPALCFVPSAFEYTVTNVTTDGALYNKQWNGVYAQSTGYMAYKWVRVILLSFLPILFIPCLNVCVAWKFVQVQRRKRQNLSPARGGGGGVGYRNHRPSPVATSFHSGGAESHQGPKTSVPDGTPRSQAAQHRARDQRTRVLMMVAIAAQFVVCMFPITIYHLLVDSVTRDSFTFRAFTTVAEILNLSNSSLNFYTYAMASRDFRQHFYQIMTHLSAATCSTLSGRRTSIPKVSDVMVEVVGVRNAGGGGPNSNRPAVPTVT